MSIEQQASTKEPPVLVTGAAGFIGYHLTKALLASGRRVVGLDNLCNYYDVSLKETRVQLLGAHPAFAFVQGGVDDAELLSNTFREFEPGVVVHLAGQAGVRYSMENPGVYTQSNLVGFANVLEACRAQSIYHLLYASSSSVYGANTKVPFDERDPVEHPVSYYAATKRANELMADSYSHLYGFASTGLRFFTVYGPLGRPDMAYYRFLDLFASGEPIRIFNNDDPENDLWRDFTFVDDVVEAITRLMEVPDAGSTPHRVVNVGNSHPVSLSNFVSTLERCLSRALGREAVFDRIYEPMKSGDVLRTFASTSLLKELTGYSPDTPLEVGLQRFVDWYVDSRGMSRVK